MTQQLGPGPRGVSLGQRSKDPVSPRVRSYCALQGAKNDSKANMVQIPQHLLTDGEMKYGKCIPDNKFSFSES